MDFLEIIITLVVRNKFQLIWTVILLCMGVKSHKIFYRFSMMLCRSGSALCVSSWCTCLRLTKVSVIHRELLQGMPSVRIILN